MGASQREIRLGSTATTGYIGQWRCEESVEDAYPVDLKTSEDRDSGEILAE
jgi:hypothetical protein